MRLKLKEVSLQTGRYGFRTGVGRLVTASALVLPLEEVTLPEAIDAFNDETGSSIAHAAIGKWHLGNCLSGGPDAARQAGFGFHAGVEQNLPDYFDYPYFAFRRPPELNGSRRRYPRSSEICPTRPRAIDSLSRDGS